MARLTRYGHSIPTGNLRPAPAAFTPELIGRIVNFLPFSDTEQALKPAPVKLPKIKSTVKKGAAHAKIIDRESDDGKQRAKGSADGRPVNGRANSRRRPKQADSAGRTAEAIPGPSGPTDGSADGRYPALQTPIKSEPAPERKATAPVAVTYANNWIGRRHQVRDAVMAFLKARFILVSTVDRDALVRTYRVSGKKYAHMLEQVVEYAETLGFQVPA